MINNLICLILLIIIALCFARKRLVSCLFTVIIYIYMAPLIEVAGRSINQTYPLTLVLGVFWLCHYTLHREEFSHDFSSKILRVYLICMGSLLVAYTVGYLINGTAPWTSFMVAMAGEVNVIALTTGLFLLLQKLEFQQIIKGAGLAFTAVLVLNIILVIWQKVSFISAYRLMDAFYVADNRFKPLYVVWQTGAFDRIMGSFFTPILLGITFLLLASLLLVSFVTRPRSVSTYLLLLPLAILTAGGILAFSKMYMLGLPIVFLLAFPGIIFFRPDIRRQALARWGIACLAVTCVYAVIYFSLPPSFVNIKHYYYGYLLKPFGGLQSRYGDLNEATKAMVEAAESPTDQAGITTDAFHFFLKSPVFGVGPLPVSGEFLGDSQFIMALHSGGLAGAASYLFFYLYIFIDALRRRSLNSALLVAVLAMACLAASALTVPESLFFVALLMRKWGRSEAMSASSLIHADHLQA